MRQNSKQTNILLVEDNPGDSRLIQEMFNVVKNENFDVKWAESLSKGLEYLSEGGFDIVLLDLSLPDSQGLETFTQLSAGARGVPVIILSGLKDEALALKAVQEGAQDYLVKGQVDSNLLMSSIRYAIERKLAEEKIRRNSQIQAALNKILHLQLEDITFEKMLEKVINYIINTPFSWVGLLSKGAIFMVEDNPEVLVLKAHKGLEGPLLEMCSRVPFGKCLCGRAALSGEVEFADCIDECHENKYEGVSSHGHYCVPIMSAGKVLGVINLYSKEGHIRNQEEENFLIAVASTLAGVIERRRLEDALRESEQRFRAIFDNATDGILLADLEKEKFHTGNRTICQMLGYSPGELETLWIKDIHPEADIQNITKVFEGQIRGVHSFAEDIPMKRRNGSIFYTDISSAPIELGRKKYLISIFRDITERKKAEKKLADAYEKLKETQEQLIQSGKMAAMGQLAAGISHELNQPLTGVKGFAQTALMEIGQDSPLSRDLNRIVEQADRMAKIIQHVRFFARKSEFQIKEIDIKDPLNDSLMLLSEQLKVHNIRVKKIMADDLPLVYGDPNQLEQVFLNLLTNARDAIDILQMPGGGEITIQSVLSEDKKHIEITVKDTGSGIPEDDLEHIFNPFYTTKSPDGGMGLGLSIVYRIIEAHKGEITAESREGKGTLIRITLPVIAGK